MARKTLRKSRGKSLRRTRKHRGAGGHTRKHKMPVSGMNRSGLKRGVVTEREQREREAAAEKERKKIANNLEKTAKAAKKAGKLKTNKNLANMFSHLGLHSSGFNLQNMETALPSAASAAAAPPGMATLPSMSNSNSNSNSNNEL